MNIDSCVNLKFQGDKMRFPEYRPRRLRKNDTLRKMVRETQLEISDFILPLFVVEGQGNKEPPEFLTWPLPVFTGHVGQRSSRSGTKRGASCHSFRHPDWKKTRWFTGLR